MLNHIGIVEFAIKVGTCLTNKNVPYLIRW